ncbi:uncharacterized protein DDB_G0271670-like [Vigna umbellata]|uniref:uncharacterized protein DDB_G0271670-like n=1 Tax=Vigna umbellata TaxID=87088 RepID=UPI001F5E9E05|nr:uncharacterized protein DDB_G0271670-like [Vigna umbellata]
MRLLLPPTIVNVNLNLFIFFFASFFIHSATSHKTNTLLHDPLTMASACVNNIAISPETTFLDLPPWLSPRGSEPEPDFEFPLDSPATMLPADQLFSDGKLVPLHLKTPTITTTTTTTTFQTLTLTNAATATISPQTPKSPSATAATTATDPYVFSPKAPRCSSRWKDLLGLKKLYHTTTPTKPSPSTTSKSLKNLLHRKTVSSSTSSENAPLLTNSCDAESLSISSRLSLSSSSSSHDHDDLPRLSLDSEKSNPNTNMTSNVNPNLSQISIHRNPNPRIRLVKPRAGSFDSNKTVLDQPSRPGRSPIRRESETVGCRGVSVDSPRMNSSGKIVFQSLERSSSSPSTFNGGPRFKHRGMERSYSANVRVTPVLNVPVCSLRGASKSGSVFGFGQLFSSPQKKETTGSNRGHHQSGRTNRN